eukprot:9480484-Karenia_brevis.AAC.1
MLTAHTQQLMQLQKLNVNLIELTPYNCPVSEFWKDIDRLTQSASLTKLVEEGFIIKVLDNYAAKCYLEIFKASQVRAAVQSLQHDINKQ